MKASRIYTILLILIIMAILVVGTMIVTKYGGNQINEKQIGELLTKIQTEQEEQYQEELKEINEEYKGYKVVGIIKIPKIELEYPILEKTSNETMKISITKFWGRDINEIGNVSLAGHNNRDGTMFGRTKELEIGDKIELTNTKRITKEYEVYDIFKTDPNDISIIDPDEIGTREVTLITCTNGNKERLIVKAREV